MAALRRRLVIAETVVVFLLSRVVDLSAVKDRMLDVLERQVMEHTELRLRLACVTPLSALDALKRAPGWQTGTPTRAEIEAHADAFPYGEAAEEEGETDDPDAEQVGGLWALQDAGGVALVELYLGRHGDPWVLFAGALTIRCECDLASTVESERITGWLPLMADGRPVGR